MKKNVLLNSDSYKLFHWEAYPPKLTHVYSYAESRGGKYPANIFFGLQGFIKEYLGAPFDITDIIEARDFAAPHGFNFNYDGWMHILKEHGGYLPLEIKAVQEGLRVPTHNVLCTVENTDPVVPWLTSYLETALLRAVWYPTTVATRIFEMKKKIKPFFDRTSDNGNMDFALLDFSSRGCASLEANEIGGSAYLTCFLGTDSIPAVRYTNLHYNCNMAGFSVAALEHSVTTSWGDASQENKMLEYLLNKIPENSVISLVGDTYNIFEFVKKLCKFTELIFRKNITVVVRPDSGNLQDVVPRIIDTLYNGFGYKINSKGFVIFNNCKILWGDGINEDTCTEIFEIAEDMKVSADSVLVGSGGGLMQANIDRDTCKFAFKASNVTIEGVDYPVAKDPITDPGKRSKKGRLRLIDWGSEGLKTVDSSFKSNRDLLEPVFRNGKILRDQNLDDIRSLVNSQINA